MLVGSLLLSFLHTFQAVAWFGEGDGLFWAASATVWGGYFAFARLVRLPVVGPLLNAAIDLVPAAACFLLYGLVG